MSHKHHNTEGQEPVEEQQCAPDAAPETVADTQSWEEAPREQELDKLKAELADAQQKLLYLQADYQNYRKRTAKDITDARIYGAANALEPFITVYDYLAMAKQAAEKSDKIEQIRQGLDMIIAQYMKAFEESGVKKVETVGKPFDPDLHEAVARECSAETPEGVVLKEWSGGYRFGERLLRPAKVVVSAGPAPEKSESKEA